MKSLFGDFPESAGGKVFRGAGYLILGLFFGMAPAVFIGTGFSLSGPNREPSWPAFLAWAACAAWTVRCGFAERLQSASRLFSGMVYCGYIFAAYRAGGAEMALWIAIGLFFLASCIWFGGAPGKSTGGNSIISVPTPRIVIAACGWFYLVGVPLVTAFLKSLP